MSNDEGSFGRQLVTIGVKLGLACAAICSFAAYQPVNSPLARACAPFAVLFGLGSAVALMCAVFWAAGNY